tara:strand:- start:979 stop:1167 length:189 start_codon:yes stop_codon:yes gene_type:complete
MTIETSRNILEPIIGPTLPFIVQELDEKFPEVNPHPKEEYGSIMYKAGQRSVVEWIKKRVDE